MKYLRSLCLVRRKHLKYVLRPNLSCLRQLSTTEFIAAKPITLQHQSLIDEYPIGRKLHGFTVQRVAEVPELCLTAVKLSHDATRASHLHLARDDHNNVFCVGFRTTPLDSTGVPHILEHTTLCGSKKYPCRDPFFKMLNRSLSTFMNAFTASDFTMYPFSTQNPKDFKNLLHVYLDSVFHPLLRPLDFLQEGWRLEHSTVDDPNSPIVFKGVVFNEMKGALADCERLFAQHLQSHILPSHTYSYVSGGDPVHIPELTYEQLKRFHETHYHPSNAWFYTYGDFHLDSHLKTIDEEVLSRFGRIQPNTSVPDEIRWQEPRKASITCRPEPLVPDPDKQTTVAVSYLLENITNSSECMALHILSALLVDGPNAPFYKSLLEPNIGSGFSPASGYNNQMKEGVFSVGLQGIHRNDVSRVVEIVDKTIDDVIKNGFADDRVDAILHGIELGFKHQTSNYGLAIIMGLSSPWNHGADPIELLQINRQVDSFKDQLRQNPRYLQDKMKQYLKDNRHRLILVMNPDEEYETKRKAAEETILKEKLCNLKESDKRSIYDRGLELNAKQSEVEDLSSLPSLKLCDVERTVPITRLDHITLGGGVPIQITCQPTNGLTYLRGVLNFRDLDDKLKPLLPIFSQVVTKMGAGRMNYRELAQKIDLKTGGFSVSTLLVEDTTHDSHFEEGIYFYSHCLEKNSEDMFSLWAELFNGGDLSDVDRLRTLINDVLVEKASGLPDSGHSYAMSRAAATVNPLSALKETFQGLEQIKTMKLLAKMDKLDPLVEQLQTIAKNVMTKNHLRLSINATHDYMPKAQRHLSDFVCSIRGTPTGSVLKSQVETFVSAGRKQHIVLPLPVNFVGRCIPAVRYNHEDFASLCILARLMTTKFLHREIREKGGAYGGGATANSSGLFTFYSYRDPRNTETLETFDLAETWAMEGTFSDRDIDEAKLSIFSEVDRPIAAGDKGLAQFLHGITDEMKQRHRDTLQQVSRENLHHATNKYLVGKQLCSQVILGPESDEILASNVWEIVKDDF